MNSSCREITTDHFWFFKQNGLFKKPHSLTFFKGKNGHELSLLYPKHVAIARKLGAKIPQNTCFLPAEIRVLIG